MKKAMAVGTMVIAVVIIVLIVFFVILLVKVRIGTLSILEDSECKSNIATHVVLLKTTGEAIVTDIYCPTKYYIIPKESDEQIKYHLAEALKTCWGTWGRGELRLFKEEGYYCHICSVIDFKEKDGTITGFTDYLIDTPTNVKDESGQSLTYFDYLTAYSSEKANPDFAQTYKELSSQTTIDKSKKYAVFFLYASGDEFIKKALENIGSITTSSTTTAGGAVLGGSTGVLIGLGVAKGAATLASAIGAGALVPGVGWFVAGGLAVGAGAGALWGLLQSNEVQWYALPLFYEYNAEALKKIGCEISPVKQTKNDAVT